MDLNLFNTTNFAMYTSDSLYSLQPDEERRGKGGNTKKRPKGGHAGNGNGSGSKKPPYRGR